MKGRGFNESKKTKTKQNKTNGIEDILPAHPESTLVDGWPTHSCILKFNVTSIVGLMIVSFNMGVSRAVAARNRGRRGRDGRVCGF